MFPAIDAWIYGADLVGAAIGSLGVVLILGILGGISTSFLLGVPPALAALLFATRILRRNIRQVLISAISFVGVSVLLGANLTGFYVLDMPIGVNTTKAIHDALYRPSLQVKIIKTRWSAFGCID